MTDATWNKVTMAIRFIITVAAILYIMQLQIANASLQAKLGVSEMFGKLVQFEQFMVQEKAKQEALKNPPPPKPEPTPDPDISLMPGFDMPDNVTHRLGSHIGATCILHGVNCGWEYEYPERYWEVGV